MARRATKPKGPTAIKEKLTKRQIIERVASNLVGDDSEAPVELTDREAKQITTLVLDGLADNMKRSIQPRSCGVFMLPGLFKVTVRERIRKAIKKGTPVRNPSTGEMIPSKGRPASKVKLVKINSLVQLKKAAAGEA